MQKALVWTAAAAALICMVYAAAATITLFILYPLLWRVQRTQRGGIISTCTFSFGLAAVQVYRNGWVNGLIVGVLSGAYSLAMGLSSWRIARARQKAELALAEKEQALQALSQAQEKLAASEHAAGVSAERARWAHEVHDTLAQGFVSIITLAQSERAAIQRGDSTSQDQTFVNQIEEEARTNLREARALISGEGPTALAHTNLAAALNRLVQESAATGNLPVKLSCQLPETLAPAVEVAVFRTVQEALTNVRRHAQAQQVKVDLHCEKIGDAIELVVQVVDDGVGIGSAPEGTGITGMRKRLAAVNGTLVIDPAQPLTASKRPGTCLEARIML